MSRPPPPEGVVLTSAAGEAVPMECEYLGTDDATHIWKVLVPEGHEHTTWVHFAAAVIPPKTSVLMPLNPTIRNP